MFDAQYDHFIEYMDVRDGEPVEVLREAMLGAALRVNRHLENDPAVWSVVSHSVFKFGDEYYLLVLARKLDA
jgi:hypothetical protein